MWRPAQASEAMTSATWMSVSRMMAVHSSVVAAIAAPTGPMKPEPGTRPCPFCLTEVPKAAVKCSACASVIEPID